MDPRGAADASAMSKLSLSTAAASATVGALLMVIAVLSLVSGGA
jgi:hypothetical protein